MSTELHDDTHRRAPDLPDAAPRRGHSGVWAIVAAVGVLVVLVLGGLVLAAQLIPSVANPFATDRVDRTGPAVLHALEELNEYRAATGHFQVVLDVEDDARYLPAALAGERTLFVAVGTVDAAVDFSGLDGGAVQVSSDRRRASISLPAPALSEPLIDSGKSYVYERQRGLLNRIGGMFSDDTSNEGELYLLAQERLREAAAETDLTTVAERNTRAMLQTLLGSLGFTDVEVSFR